MEFSCPVCGKIIPRELLGIVSHGEEHIVDEIKKKHPEWAESDGVCRKCYQYYRGQVRPHGE